MNKYDVYINCLGGSHPVVASLVDVFIKSKEHEKKWVESLREKGFSASHPNDGWVNRVANSIVLAYPQFNDGVKVGSLLMLGSHWEKENELRPVRITRIHNSLITYFFFEDIKDDKTLTTAK